MTKRSTQRVFDGEANVASLQATMDESRFSFSITGAGNISDQTGLGVDHPTSLGDGLLDFIPKRHEPMFGRLWA